MIEMIAAMDRNNVIGAGGNMPWHLPADLKRFKAITMGHAVVMGRKTFEAIGRPLPGRQNVVVTRQEGYRAKGCMVVGSLNEALEVAGADVGETVFVIGGGEIYAQAMPRAGRLHLTHVDTEVKGGDTWFPEVDPAAWREVEREARAADERNAFALEWVTYERR